MNEVRLAVVGDSVLLSGDTIAQAVAQKWEPAVIVWQLPTAAAVHTAFTVHTHLTPAELAEMLRMMASDILKRESEIPREDRPFSSPQSQDGLSGSADNPDCGDNLGGR